MRRSGQGARPQGHDVDPLEGVAEALPVPLQHLDVSEKVVGEEDRLGALEVRVPGHGGLLAPGGLHEERPLKSGDLAIIFVDDVPEVEPEVESDLVVPAPRRVKTPPRVPNHLREPGLDVHGRPRGPSAT